MANAKYTIKHPDLKPGLKIGRWTLLRIGPMNTNSRAQWFCRCKCGTQRFVLAASLKGELSLSCGCLHSEQTTKRFTKHGKVWSREYRSYWCMRQRCLQPTHGSYYRYGGRGIQICQHWLESFENFYADMGPMLSPKLSIDRKDNDGGYWCGHCDECKASNHPANCRWATQSEQSSNTRRTHRFERDGRTMSVSAWARELGMNPSTVLGRINTGWPMEDALSIPIGDFSTGAQDVRRMRKARATR